MRLPRVRGYSLYRDCVDGSGHVPWSTIISAPLETISSQVENCESRQTWGDSAPLECWAANSLAFSSFAARTTRLTISFTPGRCPSFTFCFKRKSAMVNYHSFYFKLCPRWIHARRMFPILVGHVHDPHESPGRQGSCLSTWTLSKFGCHSANIHSRNQERL
jgi:hypothetical protein